LGSSPKTVTPSGKVAGTNIVGLDPHYRLVARAGT